MDVFLADAPLFAAAPTMAGAPLAAAMLSDSLSNAPAWLMVGVSVVLVLYLTMRPKKRDPLAGQPYRPSLAQQRSLERDMQNVIVELSDMTRQMSAQLETRAAKLELLISDADARVRELRGAIDETIDRAAAVRTLSAGPPAARADPWADVRADARADASAEALSVGSSSADSPSAGSSPGARRSPARNVRRVEENPHAEDRWAEVYRLGEQGMSVGKIAQQLGRPTGEIELILALRPKAWSSKADAPAARAAPAGPGERGDLTMLDLPAEAAPVGFER